MTVADYSLTGSSAERAEQLGLVDGEWFAPSIDPERLRELQARSDLRSTVDVVLWLVLLIGSGVWAYTTIWSWWSIPAFLVYGGLYGGAADARWHECGHGTAFRSTWANDVVYHLASFMLFRGPTQWRWSHYRHHTDTIIVGRDAEIGFPRPPSVGRAAFAFLHLEGGYQLFKRLVEHAFGRLHPDTQEVVPESDHSLVVRESRVMVAILGATAIWSLATFSIVPLMFIGLPTIFGGWLLVFFGMTQHAGMQENVLDHRHSTRTVRMNPIFRFLYLNMNYHIEHHMLPSVPYRALPALHREIEDQLPPARPSTIAAYREIFHALARQQRDPEWEIPLDVPEVPSARGRIDVGEQHWVRHDDGAIDLGRSDLVGPGELRQTDIGDETYVLCRLDDGQLSLMDGRCTHADVRLGGGALVDGQIECPKHNGRFDARTGEPTRKPVRSPLCAYDVDEVDGRIVTHLALKNSWET